MSQKPDGHPDWHSYRNISRHLVGAIVTFRDKTEIQLLDEQLTGVRNYADALRAQAHEFMNKLHVILGLVRMEQYDSLAKYINETVNHRENEVAFVSKRTQDPVLAGFPDRRIKLCQRIRGYVLD
ncbi:Spo0B domain-containing protein [Peribacillus deserti]|uniref:Spo0B domain-containing protein n=1 Tax=Peribacillus deserti TaxID=673318 RepID=UPI00268AB795